MGGFWKAVWGCVHFRRCDRNGFHHGVIHCSVVWYVVHWRHELGLGTTLSTNFNHTKNSTHTLKNDQLRHDLSRRTDAEKNTEKTRKRRTPNARNQSHPVTCCAILFCCDRDRRAVTACCCGCDRTRRMFGYGSACVRAHTYVCMKT